MQRILVYSHDTFGLGNVRRMLSICRYLLETSQDLSILLVTGSPLIHSFRLPQRLDYIKLPCLSRTDRENYCTKFLGTETELTMRLRASLILSAAQNFDPDLVLVDKKPFGVKRELKPALSYLRRHRPQVPHVLVFRDILDSPEAVRRTWRTSGYRDTIFYDMVLVLGCRELFDLPREYQLPESIAEMTKFCGYIRRESGRRSRDEIRRELKVRGADPLVLVTAGGGQDSDGLMETYLAGVPHLTRLVPGLRSFILHGPEIAASEKERLNRLAKRLPNVVLRDFTDDLMSYMDAADVVVSMGGYNTICEILTLDKRAVIVPRVRPVEEQWIRAQRMERLGLFRCIHPDLLSPEKLAQAIAAELAAPRETAAPWVDLNALPRVAQFLNGLLAGSRRPAVPTVPVPVAAGEAAKPGPLSMGAQ